MKVLNCWIIKQWWKPYKATVYSCGDTCMEVSLQNKWLYCEHLQHISCKLLSSLYCFEMCSHKEHLPTSPPLESRWLSPLFFIHSSEVSGFPFYRDDIGYDPPRRSLVSTYWGHLRSKSKCWCLWYFRCLLGLQRVLVRRLDSIF